MEPISSGISLSSDELSGDEQTGDITHGQEHDERRQAAPEQFPDADERGFRYEKTARSRRLKMLTVVGSRRVTECVRKNIPHRGAGEECPLACGLDHRRIAAQKDAPAFQERRLVQGDIQRTSCHEPLRHLLARKAVLVMKIGMLLRYRLELFDQVQASLAPAPMVEMDRAMMSL